jgi:hypothetical protein
MTIPEDIVKAAKQNNLSPAITETLIRFHNQQVEMEKVINEHRKILYQLSMLQLQQTEFSSAIQAKILTMAKDIGYSDDELNVKTEEIGAN